MQILVKYVNEKVISLKVEPTDKIIDVKQQIQNIDGIPTDVIRLMFAGKELEDESRLQDYSIQKDSIIFLSKKLRGSC